MSNIAEKAAVNGRNHAAVKTQYTRLLTGFSPVAIESGVEHARALKAVAELMNHDSRSRAETSLLKLLAVLIEDYEQKRYSMGDATPLDSLKELMRARGMQAKDLWPVFGSKGITSEVLSGKRYISNDMTRRLGELFSVSPAIFISMAEIVKNRQRDIDAGVASHLAPGYDVRTTSDSGVRVVRVIRQREPLTDWKAVKGVKRSDSAERVVASIVRWLSVNFPEALKMPGHA